MAQVGDDCYYFYNSSCAKGATCPFRHVEEAKSAQSVCNQWRQGKCFVVACPFRHGDVQNRGAISCYWENQPGGCTKPHCPFLHSRLKDTVSVPPFSDVHPERSMAPPIQSYLPPVTNTSTAPGIPPPHMRPHLHRPPFQRGPMPNLPPRGIPLDGPDMGHPPPGWGPPPHQRWALPPPHASVPPHFGPGPGMVPHVEPVIVSLNSEESDQESRSPMKAASQGQVGERLVVEPDSSSILDYFLLPNRKHLVRPRSPESDRSISPDRSPYRRRSSLSPEGRDRGSASPEGTSRRSISNERYDNRHAVRDRRRSHSLDRNRSRSPDWRDSYRRRSRSRSRSPDRRHHGGRGRLGGRLGVRGRLGNQDRHKDLRDKLGNRDKDKEKNKESELEEIKAPQGPKIVSTKKQPKEKEEKEEESTDTLNPDGTVKSLEEIYRERALQSLMTAKRQKVLDMKAARWSGKRSTNTSESKSESADDKKQDSSSEAEEEKTDTKKDQKEGGDHSDVDLDADVDIELEVGDFEQIEAEPSDSSENELKEEKSSKSQESTENLEDPRKRRVVLDSDVKPVAQAKQSIKSRLGLKARSGKTTDTSKRASETVDVRRTVKQRLGEPISSKPDSKKGVIRLNRASVKDRLGFGKDRVLSGVQSQVRVGVSGQSKRIMLPKITIKQDVVPPVDEEYDSDDSEKLRHTRLKRVRHRSSENEDVYGEEEEAEEERHRSRSKKKSRKEMSEKELEAYLIEKVKRKLKKKMKRKEEKELRALKKKRLNLEARLNQENSEEEDVLKEENSDQENIATDSTSRQEVDNKSEGSQPGSDAEDTELSPVKDNSVEDVHKDETELLSHSEDSRDSQGDLSSSNKRKIVRNEDERKRVEPEVRITFKGEDRKRKLIRLNRNHETESSAPVEKTDRGSTVGQRARPFKRAWEVYVPPAMKRSGATTDVDKETIEMLQKIKKQSQREVVDYGDMFGSKKPNKPVVSDPVKPTISAPVRKTVSDTSITSSSSSPKRVEKSKSDSSQNVSVKSFAEIMAEKKRRRLQKYTPIVFEDSLDSGDAVPAVPAKYSDAAEVLCRVSPVVDSNPATVASSLPSNNNNSSKPAPVFPKQSSVPVSNSPKQSSRPVSNSQVTSSPDKLSRWKKRKSIEISETTKSAPSRLKPLKSQVKEAKPNKPESELPPKRSLSTEKKAEKKTLSSPTEEKKKNLSESLLDFEAELLEMSDDDMDLDLKDDKDHDELMRELDELLA